jgi:hypothetical protein
MTKEQFIYWLKGFIDYQQLQEQKNPAFTRIKDELAKVGDTLHGASIGVCNTSTGEVPNQSVTYKTNVPVTYTIAEDKPKSKELKSYI